MYFKKAFDSIDTIFTESALEIFGFGESFRKWVKVFFSDRKSYLLLQGFLGEAINLEQGVLQGDVLSPYIFNICVEVLLLKICFTKSTEGMSYVKKTSKAETFADG